jgi:cell division protein FtsB
MGQNGAAPRARRAGRLALYLKTGVVCALLIQLFLVIRRPYLAAARMAADNAQVERRMLQSRLEVQRLRKRARALDTPQGMEREARRLGYVKPGEVPLIIPK